MESGSKAVRSAAPEPAVAARDEEVEAVSTTPPAPPPAAAPSSRPYYECVFCKRGFTTAQALGGHMNIHRRDRANKPVAARVDVAATGVTTSSVSSSRSSTRCYSQYRHYAAYPPASAPPATTTAPLSRGSTSFAMWWCHPGAAAAAAAADAEAVVSPGSSPSPRELSLFDVAATRDHDHELHLGLGCYGRGGDGPRAPAEGSERQDDGEPVTKLDLELRLGRRPRH